MEKAMEIGSEFVGTRSLPWTTQVTPRQSMNYAAGTADDNPCYLDDLRPEGIIAPPMLAVALTWPLSSRFADFWPPSQFPLGLLTRQIHYSEHLQWRRPIRPGDQFTITGEVRAILPHRAGAHLIIEYHARDHHGALVFSEQIGGLLRGVKCTGKANGAECAPQPQPTYSPDNPRWQTSIALHPLAAHLYDACADIHFPIHSSAAFAKNMGLQRPIYQGTATLAHAVREVLNLEGGADPRRLKAVSCLFTGMIHPGETFNVRALARETAETADCIHFTVINNENKTAIRDGRLWLTP